MRALALIASGLALAAVSACEAPKPAARHVAAGAGEGATQAQGTAQGEGQGARAQGGVGVVDAPDRLGVRFVHAPAAGDVAALVRAAADDAQKSGRQLLVYVGATWCEPCQHFHHAVDRGGLDRDFPRLTLLEFDLDRDGERLSAAGYVSQMIPLFMVPGADGRASGRHMEGSIHGEAAVGEMTPRLRALLGG